MMIEDGGIAETADPKTFFEDPEEERTKKLLRSILDL